MSACMHWAGTLRCDCKCNITHTHSPWTNLQSLTSSKTQAQKPSRAELLTEIGKPGVDRPDVALALLFGISEPLTRCSAAFLGTCFAAVACANSKLKSSSCNPKCRGCNVVNMMPCMTPHGDLCMHVGQSGVGGWSAVAWLSMVSGTDSPSDRT